MSDSTLAGTAPVRVAICIATYQRAAGLQRLLEGLSQLDLGAADHVPAVQLRVVVVDNDTDGSARSVCAPFTTLFALGLQYVIEQERGIASARNRAVATIGGDADYVAMIDDDEVPEPGWMLALLRALTLYNADVVTGPVLPHFPAPVASWVRDGRFFERPRYPSGHVLPYAHTGNILVKRAVFDVTGSFDKRYGLTGGEDLQFFRRAVRCGFRIVWADDALVDEWLPTTRVEKRWLMRRSFRVGMTHGQLDRDLPDVFRARTERVVRGVGRLMQGVLLLPTAVWGNATTRTVRFVRAMQLVCRGTGMVVGVLGGRYEEYRVIHPV